LVILVFFVILVIPCGSAAILAAPVILLIQPRAKAAGQLSAACTAKQLRLAGPRSIESPAS
jgi:hypothetical protein